LPERTAPTAEDNDETAQPSHAAEELLRADDTLADDADVAPQDTWFNPYRVPKTEQARAVVRDVLNQVQGLEEHDKLRKRARKQADQERFEASVTAIIADLIHFCLSKAPGGLVVTRSKTVLAKRSRYRPPIYNKTLPAILDRLSKPEMAFIEQSKGRTLNFEGPARRTTIRPGRRLIKRIADHELTFDDLTVSTDGELIHLKRSRRGWWDESDLIEYEDSETTIRYRDEMRAINAWLEAADLDFDYVAACSKASDLGPDTAVSDLKVDVSDRRLRRIFTRGRFDSGGRLFGGFWQPLRKPFRRAGVRINGECISVLDYSQMAPMIAYGLAKATPTMGDVYRVPGYEHEDLRKGMKKFFNAMLFNQKPITKMPQGLRSYLPDPISARDLAGAIARYHPALTFYGGIGHHIQFIESQIMVRVLLDLVDKGITALPIHDAIAVARSHAAAGQEAMIREFRSIVGIDVTVNEEID
jgi:hypothetical protein